MELYEKGLSICKERYYYAKWTLLPVYIRDEGVFSIRFYFLETMMHKRAPYIQYNFDKISQQIINVKRFYGAILN